MEMQHESWFDDEVLDRLRAAGAVVCATELDEHPDPPRLFRTGPFLYARLRRSGYAETDLAAWADRLAPFLADGMDAFVFFRHDDTGIEEWLAFFEDTEGNLLAITSRVPGGPVANADRSVLYVLVPLFGSPSPTPMCAVASCPNHPLTIDLSRIAGALGATPGVGSQR